MNFNKINKRLALGIMLSFILITQFGCHIYRFDVRQGNTLEVEKLNQLNDGNYYGELDYYLSYKGEQEMPMKWLYLDYNTLKSACQSVRLNCEKIMDGEHYDYLAKLKLS